MPQKNGNIATLVAIPATVLSSVVFLVVAALIASGTLTVKGEQAPEGGGAPPASIADAVPAFEVEMSTEDAVALAEATDTQEERDEVAEALSESFAGVATIADAAPDRADDGVQQVLAYGFDRNHYWITASYADMARGVIAVAVRACQIRLRPLAGVCSYVGNLLSSWARGWGSASNHGVWAALYTWGQVTGGRW